MDDALNLESQRRTAQSPLGDTRGRSRSHQRTEVEQMEAYHKMKIRGMKNEGYLKCVMSNGSAWSTEKASLERRASELDVFIDIGNRLRGEETDEEWNAWTKQGYKIAAAAARSTKEVEDGQRTLWRSNDRGQRRAASAVDTAGDKAEGLEEHDCKCKGRLQILAVYF